MSSPSIAIVGAGIGGLATANALMRKGFSRVKVFDQAAKFFPTAGAGFGFSPNGQICLSSIGMTNYRDILHPFHKVVRIDMSGNVKQESFFLRDVLKKHGFAVAGCLRADLVDRLVEPLGDSLHYSHKMEKIEQNKDGVHLIFENGVEEEFDLVIGADGIHSRVAEQLKIDPSPPVYSGANIFYGIIPNPDSHHFECGIMAQDNTVIQSTGVGETIMFRVGPDERKCQIWACTYPSSNPPVAEEWGKAKQKKELLILLDRHQPTHPIHELASLTSPDRLLHFGLFYRKHKAVWSDGRVCLLGDACHATLPYVGQGANQAIEDAIVMSECLSLAKNTGTEIDYKDAFRSFYDQRNNRTRRIVRMATFMDKLYHSENYLIKRFLEFFLLHLMKGGFMLKLIEKEIFEDCPVKDFAMYRP